MATDADGGSTDKERQVSPVVDPDRVLQAHLYEYQALTTRCTYLITMQYAFWPIALALFALLGPLWDKHSHPLLEWGALLLGEILSLGFYFTTCELYTHILYVEHQLKPKVVRIAGESSVFQWEPWLASRPERNPAWWECWVSVFVGLAICLIAFARYPWTCADWAALLFSGIGFALIIRLNFTLVRLRHQFSKPAPS
jgi:hypothetical protein